MKKRLMKATLLTPMLLVLFFACAGDAFGRFNPESLYNITAMHTGKCLDVYGWGQGDGEKIHEFNCVEGALNQQWSIIPVGDGSEYYRIIVKHSGKALDVNGGIFTFWDGVPVKQWTYWGIANQMWKLIPVPLSNDVYQIVARHSGKSLEINVGPGPRENLG
ncbi:MAG: RICIN domain-containing protein, partial [Pyrinomonadaceae bacterium]